MQTALEAVGVAHISCNPITANNAAKALLTVAEAESMPLSKDQAQSIADAANGDLRNALEMLQLLSVGQHPTQAVPKTQKARTLIIISAISLQRAHGLSKDQAQCIAYCADGDLGNASSTTQVNNDCHTRSGCYS